MKCSQPGTLGLEVSVMKAVRSIGRVCQKGIRLYFQWLIKACEQSGDYYQPW